MGVTKFRGVLPELLRAIGERDAPGAAARVQALIAEAGSASSWEEVRLHGAILDDLRRCEAHISAGDWESAAKAARSAVDALPERA